MALQEQKVGVISAKLNLIRSVVKMCFDLVMFEIKILRFN